MTIDDAWARLDRYERETTDPDVRAILDDHARLAADVAGWRKGAAAEAAEADRLRGLLDVIGQACSHNRPERCAESLAAEIERLTRERDEYKACWLRDVEKGRAAEERLRAERVKASAAWSSSHAALVADRDRLAAALAEVQGALSLVRGCYAALAADPGILAFADRTLASAPADLAAARDARVRAEALRESADTLRRARAGISWRDGGAAADSLLARIESGFRAEAERIEQGAR